MGQIAAAAGKKKTSEGPLTAEIESFVKMTAVIATITGSVFFVLGYVLVDSNFLTEFIFMVGVFVAFVPQGLPATVLMLLTFAAMRLKDVNVLVKDLTADGERRRGEGGGGVPFFIDTTPNSTVMLQCFILNSTAKYAGGHAEGFGAAAKILGDATESGLLRFAASTLLGNEDVEAFRDRHEKV
ncbi:unnamed protein product [Sphacelaria rigidula]